MVSALYLQLFHLQQSSKTPSNKDIRQLGSNADISRHKRKPQTKDDRVTAFACLNKKTNGFVFLTVGGRFCGSMAKLTDIPC